MRTNPRFEVAIRANSRSFQPLMMAYHVFELASKTLRPSTIVKMTWEGLIIVNRKVPLLSSLKTKCQIDTIQTFPRKVWWFRLSHLSEIIVWTRWNYLTIDVLLFMWFHFHVSEGVECFLMKIIMIFSNIQSVTVSIVKSITNTQRMNNIKIQLYLKPSVVGSRTRLHCLRVRGQDGLRWTKEFRSAHVKTHQQHISGIVTIDNGMLPDKNNVMS